MGRWPRLRRWALKALIALLLFVGLAWLLWPESKISAANAERIKVGMTLTEVEVILGGQPRREDGIDGYGTIGSTLLFEDSWGNIYSCTDGPDWTRKGDILCWITKVVYIRILFDAEKKVAKIMATSMKPPEFERSTYDQWHRFIQKLLDLR